VERPSHWHADDPGPSGGPTVAATAAEHPSSASLFQRPARPANSGSPDPRLWLAPQVFSMYGDDARAFALSKVIGMLEGARPESVKGLSHKVSLSSD